jgi:pSer/pThr/pTyr-binding forkhead associated (FHA) protein
MSAILLFILRFLIAAALYAFLGWVLWTLWRELKRQDELLAARQPQPITLISEGALPQKFATPEVILGRSAACDFVLDSLTVSVQHARLTYHHGQWWVEDLQSTNGTTLHDEPVTAPVVLTNGDELRCGGVVIKIGL